MKMKGSILPSILSADFTRLGEILETLIDANIDMIHVDVMDNHYVPNLTFGPMISQSIYNRFPALKQDVHLMVEPVEGLITAFAKAGATRISIHPDACIHLDRALQLIKSLGVEVGIALNPSTPIQNFEWIANRLDFVLVMTVNPGFGGQPFIPEMINKIIQIHTYYPDLVISVDGGVNEVTLETLYKAGATQFVVGNALFNSQNLTQKLCQLTSLLK